MALAVGLSLASIGCAGKVRPVSLDQAIAASDTPKSHEAAELAPASFAEAEAYRKNAEKAFAAGDVTSANLLAETAIAAYERAFAHARIVRAERARDESKGGVDTVGTDLAALEKEQAKVSAELRDLETRIKVVLDAQPLYAIGAANDPAREKARLEASRSLATEARLLCVAARMISVDATGLSDAEKALGDLDKQLADPALKTAPIDPALRARAACLAALTQARRSARATEGATDQADALLSEVSKTGSFDPVRDDRGVAVSLAAPFTGENASKDAETRLGTLGKIAAAHKGMPLLAVIHTADDPRTGTPSERDTKRGEAVKQILLREGASKVEIVQAGASRPVIDVKVPQDRIRNERLEIVFVSRLPARGDWLSLHPRRSRVACRDVWLSQFRSLLTCCVVGTGHRRSPLTFRDVWKRCSRSSASCYDPWTSHRRSSLPSYVS